MAAQTAPTLYIRASNSVTYAYRTINPTNSTSLPLLMHIHFRANMDFWDPLLLNALAASRPVIIFDQCGVGRSSGAVPPTYQGWADSLLAFADALELRSFDLLGFSMGGRCVQLVALTRPDRRAADAYWARVHQRDVPGEERNLTLLDRDGGAKQQIAASIAWKGASGPGLSWDRLHELKDMPVLVLLGEDDALIPTPWGQHLAERIPGAEVKVYPGTGHGFIWQNAEEVARDVDSFVARATNAATKL
ncbi:Alpha/Beta hydrolase protein [Mycena albidolilacea]|uniref:Alpha/Beta hydrolase protein n=1 Tax=Mycena albidolilacea TaxID=1033008 RepID=A0AAD7F554_9AGAR|nr:Alpha/Beta hydrolase protein [Mycena albidolilacea]